MKYITAIILVIILLVGVCAYQDINERICTTDNIINEKFQEVNDDMDTRFKEVENEINAQFHLGTDICSIVGQDPTMAVYYQMPNISITDYPETTDMGTMTPEEQKLFLDILDAVKNGKDRLPYSENVNLYRILTHLGMYYGSEERMHRLFAWTETEIILRLDVFAQHEQNKVVIDARVEELLSTLKEGSDRFKLFQIAAYLAERIVYDVEFREPVDGLNGNGVCATYAMLFYKAASRLGIKTYICYGYAGDGYHEWNMVELDGKTYFYDVTWFDSEVYDFSYLHSHTSWDRDFAVNDCWEAYIL